MSNVKPWQAIATTAGLFAVFHLFVHSTLAIERVRRQYQRWG
jgi:hypothetical protein